MYWIRRIKRAEKPIPVSCAVQGQYNREPKKCLVTVQLLKIAVWILDYVFKNKHYLYHIYNNW